MKKRLFVAKQSLDGLSHYPGDGDLVLFCYFKEFSVLLLGQADRQTV
nr:hypothetical protein [Pseudoponticoccus marisrubri]